MRYALDCEFNGFGGELLSLALVREDRESLYIVLKQPKKIEPWVKENVLPVIWAIPSPFPGAVYGYDSGTSAEDLPWIIQHFLSGYNGKDPRHVAGEIPHIISDWPDDIAYFCRALMTSPGTMVSLPRFTCEVNRVQSYPTDLKGAVQHNAFWDAKALWRKCVGEEST